jgi:hypothetical protein
VTPAAPTVTWADPAGIGSGTPLSSARLDATADVAGTFTYAPAAGTVLGYIADAGRRTGPGRRGSQPHPCRILR